MLFPNSRGTAKKKKKKLYDEQLEDRNDFALVTVICICFVTERIGGFVIMG